MRSDYWDSFSLFELLNRRGIMMILRASQTATAIAITLLLVGCSSGTATLTLHPQGQNVAFAKTFSHAYVGKDADGSYACVLVSDDAPAVAAASGKSITPADAAPLRQIVHIKVLWRPLNGMRDTVASNAAIDWYVMSTTGGDDLLVYQGAGSVILTPDGDHAKVNIRSADLKPALTRGSLKDPIGNANITGAFTAKSNNREMNAVLAGTRERLATVASGSGG
jgi:hypothetical protein